MNRGINQQNRTVTEPDWKSMYLKSVRILSDLLDQSEIMHKEAQRAIRGLNAVEDIYINAVTIAEDETEIRL